MVSILDANGSLVWSIMGGRNIKKPRKSLPIWEISRNIEPIIPADYLKWVFSGRQYKTLLENYEHRRTELLRTIFSGFPKAFLHCGNDYYESPEEGFGKGKGQ